VSFAAARPKKGFRIGSTRVSPLRTAATYDRRYQLWRDADDGIEEDYPHRRGGRRSATTRTRPLLVAVALLLGAVVGALGQHVVASQELDLAMVEIAETMIDRLRSLARSESRLR
jgi:hypothetical protein